MRRGHFKKGSRECKKQSGDYKRYYKIGGITVLYHSDLPITPNMFHPCFKLFEVSGPEKDMVSIRQRFFMPRLKSNNLGVKVYDKAPWKIYKRRGSWVYLNFSYRRGVKHLYRIAIFNADYSRVRIFDKNNDMPLRGNLPALTSYPIEQILLARTLAFRQGCYFHSCGVDFEGKGILLAGHSGAGKSTIAALLKDKLEVLSDERIILRKINGRFKIFGTWQHGDMPCVSARSVPLKAILLLEKSKKNQIVPIKSKQEIIGNLLGVMIRPFVTADCWEKSLDLVEDIAKHIPVYWLKFDKSGKAFNLFKKL